MNQDRPWHLVFVMLNRSRTDFVDVSVRLSGAPESTAETNSLPLDEFRRIFLNVFKTPQDHLDRDIQRLREGHGFTIDFFTEMDSIRKSGLLTPPGHLGTEG
jgi:hypothetical protein